MVSRHIRRLLDGWATQKKESKRHVCDCFYCNFTREINMLSVGDG